MSHRPAKEDGSTGLRFIGFLLVTMGTLAGSWWLLWELVT